MLTRLQYFNAIVELGSISAASQYFDIQPSSISRQLANLERELGVRLLNRTTRNLGLTEAGQQYYAYSRRIVAELDEAKRAVNDMQQQAKGRLKVSMTVGFGEAVVLPSMATFKQQYPEVELELELTERVVDMVEENVDVAIRSGILPDSSLVAKKLMANDFILCASPEFIKQHGSPATVAEITQFPCIQYGYSGWKNWYLIDNKGAEKIALTSHIVVNTVQGQKQLIINHAGLALIPRWAVSKELSRGQLCRVLSEDEFSPQESPSSTYAIYLKRDLVAPKVKVFVDFIAGLKAG
ncbi:LysR family transcriptional regulator [Motiliproteus coralliicola]|uniref:LysR family transcriptional regulator n=1 Tax=Motiliproteus coralliicola TaxID=2283196 RepID=A0A369WWC6_9GAMM|nr:LysR family transcriptional regulator [Motiliproteus coralliicola]